MIVAMDRSFNFEPFKQCGDAMYRIRMHLRNIEELRGSAVALREYFRKSSERYGIECHPSPGYMKPMENKIDYMLSTYRMLQDMLHQSQHTVIERNHAITQTIR
jgi:hypothetical protein